MYYTNSSRFELITGPMGCGKTEELIKRIRRAQLANKNVRVFSPVIDTRSRKNHIESRSGHYQTAMVVEGSADLLKAVNPVDEVVGIDELQFFDNGIIEVIRLLTAKNIRVIASGLDLDFRGEPFGCVPYALALADRVDKLTAVCMSCGSEYANRTQRLINGEPARYDSPLIMVGGDESYEARCLRCYELPEGGLLAESEEYFTFVPA